MREWIIRFGMLCVGAVSGFLTAQYLLLTGTDVVEQPIESAWLLNTAMSDDDGGNFYNSWLPATRATLASEAFLENDLPELMLECSTEKREFYFAMPYQAGFFADDVLKAQLTYSMGKEKGQLNVDLAELDSGADGRFLLFRFGGADAQPEETAVTFLEKLSGASDLGISVTGEKDQTFVAQFDARGSKEAVSYLRDNGCSF